MWSEIRTYGSLKKFCMEKCTKCLTLLGCCSLHIGPNILFWKVRFFIKSLPLHGCILHMILSKAFKWGRIQSIHFFFFFYKKQVIIIASIIKICQIQLMAVSGALLCINDFVWDVWVWRDCSHCTDVTVVFVKSAFPSVIFWWVCVRVGVRCCVSSCVVCVSVSRRFWWSRPGYCGQLIFHTCCSALTDSHLI